MSWLRIMHYVLTRTLPQQLANCRQLKGGAIIYRQMPTADNEVRRGQLIMGWSGPIIGQTESRGSLECPMVLRVKWIRGAQ